MMTRMVTSLLFLVAGFWLGCGCVLVALEHTVGWWLIAVSALPLWRGIVWTRRDEAAA